MALDQLARIAGLLGIVSPRGSGATGPQGAAGKPGKLGPAGPAGVQGPPADALWGAAWLAGAWPGAIGMAPTAPLVSGGTIHHGATYAVDRVLRSIVVSIQTAAYVRAGAPGTQGNVNVDIWGPTQAFTGPALVSRSFSIPSVDLVDGILAEAYRIPVVAVTPIEAGSVVAVTLALQAPDVPADTVVLVELSDVKLAATAVLRPQIPVA